MGLDRARQDAPGGSVIRREGASGFLQEIHERDDNQDDHHNHGNVHDSPPLRVHCNRAAVGSTAYLRWRRRGRERVTAASLPQASVERSRAVDFLPLMSTDLPHFGTNGRPARPIARQKAMRCWNTDCHWGVSECFDALGAASP